MIKIITTLLIFWLLIFSFPAFCCELTAGYDESVPFHYSDENKKVIGTDAQTLQEVLSLAECRLIFKELPWSRTLQGVENGTIDIAIGAKHTEERALFAFYSTPYKNIQHWLYTQAGQHDDINSLSEFMADGKMILGVVRGWGYPPEIAREINDDKNKLSIVKVSTFEQLPQMFERNRLDGFIAIPENLEKVNESEPLTRALSVRARYQEPLHFLYSKKSVSSELVQKLNKALEEMIDKGRIREIFRAYQVDP